MGKNSVADLLSVDNLFTTQAERDEATRESILDIPLNEISDFPDHPFKVRMDENMMDMVESVKQYGVLVPALVRPKPDGGYEMIAGHRRKMASELAGKPILSCIVRDMTDDEATIVMVDSNLQREQILPSEKAFAYKMKLDAMKRQGQRTDLTLSPVATKLDTAAKLGQQSGESRDQVFRYIRLTHLIPDILELVDNSVLKEKEVLQIALRPAVELSYLTETEQQDLLEIMESEDCTPSHAQAIKMRQFSQEGRLDANVLLSIMQEEKPNQVEQFKIPRERISKFFSPGTPAKKMEDTIVKALELYRNEYRMTMKGTLSHTAVLGADVFGNLTRMDNVIDGLPGKLEAVRAELAETQVQIENARSELAAPFAREAELTEKTARLKELNILLNMDQKDNALIDDAPDEEAPERPRSKGMER